MNPPPEKITVTEAHMECWMCPTIIVGTTANDWTIYARYRWGHLSVRLDPREPAPFSGALGYWIYEAQLDPNGLDGYISYEYLRELTADIIDWPPELTPRTYDDSEASSLDDLA